MRLMKMTDCGPVDVERPDTLLPGDRFVLLHEKGDDPAAIEAVLRYLACPRRLLTVEQP